MTDDLLPPASPDDELVSAVLDGEATDAQRARVEGDPQLQARLVELREVRDALAGPVLIDDATREAGLAAALAAASETGGLLASGSTSDTDDDASTDPPAGRVVDLAARRRTRLTVAVAAVAAVVVLAVVVPLAIGRTSTETYATGAAVDDAAAPRSTVAGSGGAASRSGSAERSADGAVGPAAPNAAAGRAPTTTASALPLATIPPDSPAVVAASYLGDDLGTVATPTEVHDRVEARFNATRQDVHEEGEEPQGGGDEDHGTAAAAPPGTYLPPEAQREIVLRLQACDPVVRAAEPGLGVTIFTAGLVYQGVPALVFLYDGPPTATNRLVTVDRATCSVLDRQPSPF